MTLFLSFEKTQPCSSRKLIVAASDVQLFLKYSSIISFVGYQVKKGDRVSVCSGRVRRVCLLAIVVAILSVPTFAAHYITFRAGLFDCITNRARARRGMWPAKCYFESPKDIRFTEPSFMSLICISRFPNLHNIISSYTKPRAVSNNFTSIIFSFKESSFHWNRPGLGAK